MGGASLWANLLDAGVAANALCKIGVAGRVSGRFIMPQFNAPQTQF
jgi:hypothetical protein